jgi:hypothetical protein
MRAWTGVEILEERDRLEREAATILGFMIFEYSRLDMELGWFLSWADDGNSLEKLTKKLGALNFSKRLEFLQKSVASKFRDSPSVVEAYANWLSDAHAIRELRNQLFHGRWGVEPIQQRVVNVVGLPNSPSQESTPYSIADLQSALASMRDLRARLQKLRSSCPV